jgi:AmiR/NasT family two-component response regulator
MVLEYAKFILNGDDKKVLSHIKNTLASNGHIYLGYTKDSNSILRHIRSCLPDLIIIDATNKFHEMKRMLEVIDEEILAACILILDNRSDDIIEFLRKSRVISYLAKPVFDEALLQVIDMSLINYSRVLNYEQKVKKLNETLESRKVVEKAKWILIEKDGFTEAEAYEAIQRKSRDSRIPMLEIAEAIILTRG